MGESTEPPLKLVLLENPGHGGSLNHLGVEACYAKQDKFWVQGAPNGERWEIYTVLADSQTFSAQAAEATTCCGTDVAASGEPEPSAAACC